MTPADPDYGIHNSRTPPEELLIFSILSRAILDLFGPVGLTSNKDEADTAKSDALMFLTQETGGWAKRRKELCDAVGIDGDEMRDRVIRVLEGDMMALNTYEGRGSLSQVDQARALWEREKNAHKRVRSARAKGSRTIASSPPRPQHKVTRYSDVRAIILPLLEQPKKFKDLIMATDGDVSDSTIRLVLNYAIEKGEVVRDAETHVYSLVPQTAVAAEAA